MSGTQRMTSARYETGDLICTDLRVENLFRSLRTVHSRTKFLTKNECDDISRALLAFNLADRDGCYALLIAAAEAAVAFPDTRLSLLILASARDFTKKLLDEVRI